MDVKVYDDLLPPELVTPLAAAVPSLAGRAAMWVPAAAIEGWTTGDVAALRGLPEHVVGWLHRRLMVGRLAGQGFVGAEWWCQCRPEGEGMAFHVDKDERRMVRDGALLTPVRRPPRQCSVAPM